jgi:crotonobetainyl-CoA:carnitine CoA-transferase CaiB-like acyl-CoA transferase
MTLGKVARAESRERNQAPLMNPYRAGDGRWFFFTGLEAARHIPAVCRALGHPELLDDPRFADAGAIRRNRAEVIAILDEIVARQPLDVWARRFDQEGVWWAPALTPAEVVADPQLLANEGIVEIDGGGTGTVQRSVNGPVSFSDVGGRRYAPVPLLGQHTAEVLAELADRTGAPPARS